MTNLGKLCKFPSVLGFRTAHRLLRAYPNVPGGAKASADKHVRQKVMDWVDSLPPLSRAPAACRVPTSESDGSESADEREPKRAKQQVKAAPIATRLRRRKVQHQESATAISSSASDSDGDNDGVRTANLHPKESFCPLLSSPDTDCTYGYTQCVSPLASGSAHSVIILDSQSD